MDKEEIKQMQKKLDIEFEKVEDEIRRFKIKVDSVMDYIKANI